MFDKEEERAEDPPALGSPCQEGVLGRWEEKQSAAPWQRCEVCEEGEGAHTLPACLLALADLAHLGIRGGWKSLALRTSCPLVSWVRSQTPVTCGITSDILSQVPQSSAWPSPASPLTWPPVLQLPVCGRLGCCLHPHYFPLQGLVSCLCLGASLLVNCLSFFVFSVL